MPTGPTEPNDSVEVGGTSPSDAAVVAIGRLPRRHAGEFDVDAADVPAPGHCRG
jgi:hypothetical protein